MPPVPEDRTTLRRLVVAVSVTTAIVAAVVLATLIVVKASDILFLLFGGVLLGIFLMRTGGWMQQHTPLNYGWSLLTVISVIGVACLGCVLLFGMQIQEQVEKSFHMIEDSITQARENLEDWPRTREALAQVPLVGNMIEKREQKEENTSNTNQGDKEKGNSGSRQDSTGDGKDEATSNSDSSKSESSKSDSSKSGGTRDVSSAPAASVPQELVNVAPSASTTGTILSRLFYTPLGFLVNLLLITVVGIYLAIEPGVYRRGLVRLMPPARRQRTDEVLDQLYESLWRWIVGRLATMAITGVSTGLVLWLLGVPLAAMVGVLTALLTFIPNIGALIAFVIAVLLAMPEGWNTVLAVVALYTLVQFAESYLITPMIQKRQVSMPPALLIGFQALMGVLFGFVGMAIASPFLVVLAVLINELYLTDALGERCESPGLAA